MRTFYWKGVKVGNIFSDVELFMRAVGHTTNQDNLVQSLLYKKLVVEEYDEFIDSINSKDDAKTLDACFDLIWVTIGYMKSRGWPCEPAWIEGAKSNLAKIDPDTKTVIRREDGKILKPNWWQPPNFEQFV